MIAENASEYTAAKEREYNNNEYDERRNQFCGLIFNDDMMRNAILAHFVPLSSFQILNTDKTTATTAPAATRYRTFLLRFFLSR